MKSKQETFGSLLESFSSRYDLHTVFDDFLTLFMCSVTRNLQTGLSHYEKLYLETIAKYKDDELRFQFPKMFGALVTEMSERRSDHKGNDVLGEYYEMHLPKKKLSQFFTPWAICKFMAKSCAEETVKSEGRVLRVLEPACGSGRLLLAAAKEMGPKHEYYGVDIDSTCVKMTVLNLFLNRVFNAEVMCGNALLPDDFRGSYVVSCLPFGIFRIEKKEESRLWHLMKNAFAVHRENASANGSASETGSGDTDPNNPVLSK